MVKNLSVAVLDLCFLKHVKELPWEGFLPNQGLSGIIIDLDTVILYDFFLAPLHHEILQFFNKRVTFNCFIPFQIEMVEYDSFSLHLSIITCTYDEISIYINTRALHTWRFRM